jgi:hypothetical protein
MVLPRESFLLTETITNHNRDVTEIVSHCDNHIVGIDVNMY